MSTLEKRIYVFPTAVQADDFFGAAVSLTLQVSFRGIRTIRAEQLGSTVTVECFAALVPEMERTARTFGWLLPDRSEKKPARRKAKESV